MLRLRWRVLIHVTTQRNFLACEIRKCDAFECVRSDFNRRIFTFNWRRHIIPHAVNCMRRSCELFVTICTRSSRIVCGKRTQTDGVKLVFAANNIICLSSFIVIVRGAMKLTIICQLLTEVAVLFCHQTVKICVSFMLETIGRLVSPLHSKKKTNRHRNDSGKKKHKSNGFVQKWMHPMLSKFEYAVQLKLSSCFVRKQNLYSFVRNSAVAVDDINA